MNTDSQLNKINSRICSTIAFLVPENIVFGSIGRAQYLASQITQFTNALCNPQPEEQKLSFTSMESILASRTTVTLVLSNPLMTYMSFFKPALTVAPDAFNSSIQGPFFFSDSHDNDAAMLR